MPQFKLQAIERQAVHDDIVASQGVADGFDSGLEHGFVGVIFRKLTDGDVHHTILRIGLRPDAGKRSQKAAHNGAQLNKAGHR